MNPISNITTDTKKVLNMVMDRMISTRSEAEVKFLPYTHSDAVSYQHRHMVMVDFSKIYKDFSAGDCAHIKTNLISEESREFGIVLAVAGCARAVLNGEEICVQKGGFSYYPIKIKKGDNELIIKTMAQSDRSFGFEYSISVYRYPGMWASDYLFSTRATLPLDCYEGQDGMLFSEIYSYDERDFDKILALPEKDVEYISPVGEDFGGSFDFNRFNTEGNCAYAYTVTKNGIEIKHTTPIRIFIDNIPVYTENAGVYSIAPGKEINVLIKAIKADDGWGFEAVGDAHLPFECPYGWIWVGGFNADSIYSVLPPEISNDFKTPFTAYDGEMRYWRFNRHNTYLRPVLDTFFFGQWFYALMVGVHGLRIAAEELGRTEYISYFNRYMEIMCDWFDYSLYDMKMFNNPSMLPRAPELDNLDAIGTIGMNLCDFYASTNYPKAKDIILILADAVEKNIPRFEDDRTFHRGKTMWADDIYMSCPFLVRAGAVLGREDYFTEAINQIKGYHRRMWIAEDKLFSHIFFPEEGVKSCVPWGRGNGWVLLSITEMMKFVPGDFEGMNDIREIFLEFAEGVRSCIGSNGMWHQVLNRSQKESYDETSCTAMFTVAFVRGFNMGILDEKYYDTAKKAWAALLEYGIEENGDVYGVCMGSGCSKEAEYYFTIPTAVNDDHGTGIVLMAGTEIYRKELSLEKGQRTKR